MRSPWIRSRQLKKVVEIPGSLVADLLNRKAAQSGDLACNFDHECRFVALAAVRDRRKERRIRFDEHALERYLACGLADIFSLGEGHISGERNHESEIESGARVLHGSGKAVQYAAKPRTRPALANEGKALLPGIVGVIG